MSRRLAVPDACWQALLNPLPNPSPARWLQSPWLQSLWGLICCMPHLARHLYIRRVCHVFGCSGQHSLPLVDFQVLTALWLVQTLEVLALRLLIFCLLYTS